MHTAGTGPIKTIVAIGFVAVIPLIAVFGLPERESVVASSGGDDVQRMHQRSVGVGESARYGSDDLFADFPHDPKANSDSVGKSLLVNVSASDPFQIHPSMRDTSDDPFLDRTPSVPATALVGWSLQRPNKLSPPVVSGFASRFAAGAREKDRPFVADVQPTLAAKGRSVPPIPRDTKRVPRNAASQNGSGPKRFRHRHDEQSEQPSTRKKDAQSAKSPVPQTWRTAVRRLNELGIHHFRLEPGRRVDEFHFHCSFTPSDTPRITQRFEAEAAEPLRAVQKVIVQVEQWLQRR